MNLSRELHLSLNKEFGSGGVAVEMRDNSTIKFRRLMGGNKAEMLESNSTLPDQVSVAAEKPTFG